MIKKIFLFMVIGIMITQIKGRDIQQASAERINQIRGISAQEIAEGTRLIKERTRPAAVGKNIIEGQSLSLLENIGQRIKGRFPAKRINVQEETKKLANVFAGVVKKMEYKRKE